MVCPDIRCTPVDELLVAFNLVLGDRISVDRVQAGARGDESRPGAPSGYTIRVVKNGVVHELAVTCVASLDMDRPQGAIAHQFVPHKIVEVPPEISSEVVGDDIALDYFGGIPAQNRTPTGVTSHRVAHHSGTADS